MINTHSTLREFGRCRLDIEKKLLWADDEPVGLPLKAIELLCLLVENPGAVVTKDEIWRGVWDGAFVEETNLTHNIYLLRKAFRDLGEDYVIKTIPRRGYRFTAEVREVPRGDVVIEKHTSTQTVIEIQESSDHGTARSLWKRMGASRPSTVFAALCVLILFSGAIFFLRSHFAAVPASEKLGSIAVLPVKAFSSDSADEELQLRITDALIARIGSSHSLAVRPTSAVMPFAESRLDAVEIGKRLQVNMVLESRMQRENDRLRVTSQLINVSTGEQIWSDQFDGRIGHILDLQDLIWTRFAATVDPATRTGPETAGRPTQSAEAYEAYLKGRYFWSKRDETSLRKAVEYFTQATALDPKFSEAFSSLADTQHLLFNYNIDVTPDIVSAAKENLHTALELKPGSADALITLGTIQMGYDWDWVNAESSLRRAVSAAPNSTEAHVRLGSLLVRTRKFDEAISEFRNAVALDPLSVVGHLNLGMALFCEKNYPSADAEYAKALELDDKNGAAHWLISRSLWQQGRSDESIAEIVTALQLDGNAELSEKIRSRHQKTSAADAIRLLLDEWKNDPPGTNPHNLAYLSTNVGDLDKAVYWLGRSYNEHHPWTAWIAAAPEFEILKDDPRYRSLVQKMGLDR